MMKGIDTFAEPFEEIGVKNVVIGVFVGLMLLFGIKKGGLI